MLSKANNTRPVRRPEAGRQFVSGIDCKVTQYARADPVRRQTNFQASMIIPAFAKRTVGYLTDSSYQEINGRQLQILRPPHTVKNVRLTTRQGFLETVVFYPRENPLPYHVVH